MIGSVPPTGFFGGNAADMSSMSSYAGPDQTAQAWAGYQWGGAADPTKAADPNVSAAWAAYYQQYYGQAVAGTPTAPAGTGATALDSDPNSANPQASLNPQTGQADYSQAWIEYYRSLGMHEQADAIMRQIQTTGTSTDAANGSAESTNGQQQQPVPPSGPGAQTNGSAATATSAADQYASQTAAWQQYSQSQYNYANYYKQEAGPRNG